MVRAGKGRRRRRRKMRRRAALSGTSGIPQTPITTCHMPLGRRADLGPGRGAFFGFGAEMSRTAEGGWVLHHASGHPC